MRALIVGLLLSIFTSSPLIAQDQLSSSALSQVVDKIIARENQEMGVIRQRSPIVETYVQKVRTTGDNEGWQPDGDHYFIGRADLPNGLALQPLEPRDQNSWRRILDSLNRVFNFGNEFYPEGFLQMIYPDAGGLNSQNYTFDYARREFLGEVRTLVFDVQPAKNAGRGRFLGRIWVEDQGFTIVRFNGTYVGKKNSNVKFHFDSWRVNCGPNLWLPAFIYSEVNSPKEPLVRAVSFKAQTRLWGYGIGHEQQAEELSKVVIESAAPVVDKSQQDTDLTPLQQKRAWDAEAENNIIDKFQTMGLIAPRGEVDKILDTVVNNLEVTNNLNFSPEIQCRVLMTSTIESFSIGHIIVLSRGLIDVLPDEASLAAMLAKEIGIVMLERNANTRFGFDDRLLHFDERATFQHFNFNHNPEDDAKASAKAAELLKNSPYKDQLHTPESFVAELQQRSHEIPNLISPRLGDATLLQLPVDPTTLDQSAASHIVALPLGGRIKVDPWSDHLDLLKAKPVGSVAEREKMPFEITPFVLYLTRVGS
jgi:hypothetical protein